MTEFDPGQPSFVHDRLNGQTIKWEPGWRESYVQQAHDHSPGVVEWDGRLLDGWLALVGRPQ